jgi:NitT/TauT family transport system substrate-binding protein
MLSDKDSFGKAGTLRASYVYDNTTGLKIFGHIATYVKGSDGIVTAFMRKIDAEAFATSNGGSLMAAGSTSVTGELIKQASMH